MKTLKLLIIEDDEPQLITYRDTIEGINQKGTYYIEFLECKKYEDGERALLSPYYDAAIIDLKLSSSDIGLKGIDLIEKVYKKLRIPIFVVSGSISQIEHIAENSLFKKRSRTILFSEILDEIIKIYDTGITSFLKPNGLIDIKLSEIFWTNLANDLEIWIENKSEKSLLRYIFSHFQEHMEINSEGDFEQYHPSEVYIKPPIKKNFHTGDLILSNEEYYVVLTPACDIVFNYKKNEKGEMTPFRKSEKMVAAKAAIFNVNEYCKNKEGKPDKGKISQYIKNEGYRFHYLPPFEDNSGFLIDFQALENISYEDQIHRVASISAPFIKDIISRFSNYYSRQGQPTFGQNVLIESLFESAKNANTL